VDVPDPVRRRQPADADGEIRLLVLTVVAAAVASLAATTAAPGARAADACTWAGVTRAVARSAYGRHVELLPLTEPGNGPAALAHVPACFVSARGTVVATVRKYSRASRGELLAIYRAAKPRPRSVPLRELGAGAYLFLVVARPGHYEEDLLFSAGSSVVSVRSQVLTFARVPAAPLPGLAALARGIRAYFG
jgi:hypothetical protein